MKDSVSFLNGLVGALIGIVWYPSTVEVYCGEGNKTAAVRLTPEQLRAIALQPDTAAWAEMVSPVKAAELAEAVRVYVAAHKNVAAGTPNSVF